MLTVTTSWDDGDAHDMRIAGMLDRYGLRGTFYVTRDQTNRLSEGAIYDIARRQEIGAHTLSHVDVSTIPSQLKWEEIEGSKKWLESITQKNVDMFCYPFGRFDPEAKDMVKKTGFLGARSTIKTLGTIPTDVYELPVTMMTYRAPFGLLEKMLLPIRGAKMANTGWETLVHAKFKTVESNAGVFHLWGHSWEIDRLKLWDSLDAFLSLISRKPNVRYVTNGELIQLLQSTPAGQSRV
jgi:peptidoglycan/xylan/chitin deacetylase (PgdA/CDA1 family)